MERPSCPSPPPALGTACEENHAGPAASIGKHFSMTYEEMQTEWFKMQKDLESKEMTLESNKNAYESKLKDLESKVKNLESTVESKEMTLESTKNDYESKVKDLEFTVEANKNDYESKVKDLEFTVESTDRISGTEFISRDRTRSNISMSSTHLDSKARPVFVKGVAITPIQLPESFWRLHVFGDGSEGKPCWNESNFQRAFCNLMDDVHRGLRKIKWISQEDFLMFNTEITLAGARTDIAVTKCPNQLICGVVEMKKHDKDKSSKIFDSMSLGVGQMFTQLVLSSSGLRGPGFAAISTFNELRLYSDQPFEKSMSLLQTKSFAKASETANTSDSIKQTSPDRMPGVADEINYPPKKDARTPAPFQCYAMKLARLGNKEDSQADLLRHNKEYIEMLATFLLLTVQSGKQGPRVIGHLVPLEAVAVRMFDLKKGGQLSTKYVEYNGGINFLEYPTSEDTEFHVWTQLGEGATGVCCLATAVVKQKKTKIRVVITKIRTLATGTREKGSLEKARPKCVLFAGVPCVLKIFHREVDKISVDHATSAKIEASNWSTIYGDEKWVFIKAHVLTDFTILVMPYFHSPNQRERLLLLGSPEAAMQESMLWKGLFRFARNGMKHEDLKWRHVGMQRNEQSEPVKVFLFDLGNVSKLDEADVDSWVRSSYDYLRECA